MGSDGATAEQVDGMRHPREDGVAVPGSREQPPGQAQRVQRPGVEVCLSRVKSSEVAPVARAAQVRGTRADERPPRGKGDQVPGRHVQRKALPLFWHILPRFQGLTKGRPLSPVRSRQDPRAGSQAERHKSTL